MCHAAQAIRASVENNRMEGMPCKDVPGAKPMLSPIVVDMTHTAGLQAQLAGRWSYEKLNTRPHSR